MSGHFYNKSGLRVTVPEFLNMLKDALSPVVKPLRVGVTSTARAKMGGVRNGPGEMAIFLWFGGYAAAQRHGMVSARILFDLMIPAGMAERQDDTVIVTDGRLLQHITGIAALIENISFPPRITENGTSIHVEVQPPTIEGSEWISFSDQPQIAGHRVSALFPMILPSTKKVEIFPPLPQ